MPAFAVVGLLDPDHDRQPQFSPRRSPQSIGPCFIALHRMFHKRPYLKHGKRFSVSWQKICSETRVQN